MTIQAPTSITVDSVDYPVSGFSESVQRLVAIHTEWQNELSKERMAVAKTEAAVRALNAELTQLVSSELSAKAESDKKESVVESPCDD